MTEKVADYERLLRDLMSRVSEHDVGLIKASLEKVRVCGHSSISILVTDSSRQLEANLTMP